MATMKFKTFTWMELPEELTIRAVRVPEFQIDENGKYNYTGLSPMCRVIRGKGVFRGAYANEYFNALQVLLAAGTAGDLEHSVWGKITCFLTEVEMGQDCREGYLEYSFVFREADESGVIPALPEEKWNRQ